MLNFEQKSYVCKWKGSLCYWRKYVRGPTHNKSQRLTLVLRQMLLVSPLSDVVSEYWVGQGPTFKSQRKATPLHQTKLQTDDTK